MEKSLLRLELDKIKNHKNFVTIKWIIYLLPAYTLLRFQDQLYQTH